MEIKNCTVLIVGAGPAGLSAAWAAARLGAEVTILEKSEQPGGMIRDAFLDAFTGVASSMAETRLLSRGIHAYGRRLYARVDLEAAARECLETDKIQLLLGVCLTGVDMKNGAIRTVSAWGRGESFRLRPVTVIDATGTGDVAALSGVPFLPGRTQDGAVIPPCVRLCAGGCDITAYLRGRQAVFFPEDGLFGEVRSEVSFHGHMKVTGYRRGPFAGTASQQDRSDIQRNFSSDTQELLAFVKRSIPGMKDAYPLYTSQGYLYAEGPHPIGRHMLEFAEIQKGMIFPDWAAARISCEADLPGMAFREEIPEYTVPYGSLTTQNVRNLLLCGRCVSATHEAYASLRAVPACMATGQAAGIAAALSLMEGGKVKKIDVACLQDIQKELGMAPPVTEPAAKASLPETSENFESEGNS